MSGFFFYKQKTAYEMRIRDWSSDVCSSDLSDCAPATRAEKQGELIPNRAVRYPQHGIMPSPYCRDKTLPEAMIDRKSVVQGKSVSVRVDLGGRRIIRKNTQSQYVHIPILI